MSVSHFEANLETLKQRLLSMAALASNSVRTAMRALVERDDDLARSVIDDDCRIDELEMEIDELSIQLLAKAPLASDLRLITVAMKACYDLERVGDEATTIARRALELAREPELAPRAELPRMAEMALGMLSEALDAFINRGPAKARAVIPRDKELDALNKQVHRVLAEQLASDPALTSRCLNLMVISKCLERIGDHVKNVAEEVVYLYEAQDIRHPHAKLGG
jgi:phosphate transport system protein